MAEDAHVDQTPAARMLALIDERLIETLDEYLKTDTGPLDERLAKLLAMRELCLNMGAAQVEGQAAEATVTAMAPAPEAPTTAEATEIAWDREDDGDFGANIGNWRLYTRYWANSTMPYGFGVTSLVGSTIGSASGYTTDLDTAKACAEAVYGILAAAVAKNQYQYQDHKG